MKIVKRCFAALMAGAIGLSLCACGSGKTAADAGSATGGSTAKVTDADRLALLADYKQDSESLTFDNSAWKYDADNDVYYQIGVAYCSDAAAADYETLGIYVPGAYMKATDNGNGTYTCEVNAGGKAGSYTAATAPIVFPVNTPGYVSQAAPTEYSFDGLSDYLQAGLIYVYAGMRGRDNGYNSDGTLAYSGGAPWGVTDLKSAIRYYRFNAASLPGNTDSIFTFGMSGGGAQSALAGATGDSTLYFDYLTSIGSAMVDAKGNYLSDAVSGSMCWCPITSLDYADEAYEWNMGQYETTGTRADGTWTKALSDDLAASYADYINALGLTDENGNTLSLTKSDSGIYASGSYYDYLVSVIETSLNNFLSDTTFPYTPSNSFSASGNFGGGGTDASASQAAADIASRSGSAPSGTMPSGGQMPSGTMSSGGMPSGGMGGSGSSQSSTTYATVQDYIDSLNADGEWIKYDASTNTATITSIADFVTNCKNATKDVTAFDGLDRGNGENSLFGNDDSNALHFDSTIYKLLQQNGSEYAKYTGWDASVVSDFASDLALTDALGKDAQTRQNMYNPMYYLCGYYDGEGTSNVAAHWRIRTGIDQGDTALTVETNLALALSQCAGVKDVDFATVWGMQHTLAERSGDSTTNFIAWVDGCVNG